MTTVLDILHLLEAGQYAFSPDETAVLISHFKQFPPLPAGDPEVQRREQPSITSWPLRRVPGDTSPMLDYGSAGSLIDSGKMHLDEALPNGQKLRGAYAYERLVRGVKELGLWMEKKGYFE